MPAPARGPCGRGAASPARPGSWRSSAPARWACRSPPSSRRTAGTSSPSTSTSGRRRDQRRPLARRRGARPRRAGRGGPRGRPAARHAGRRGGRARGRRRRPDRAGHARRRLAPGPPPHGRGDRRDRAGPPRRLARDLRDHPAGRGHARPVRAAARGGQRAARRGRGDAGFLVAFSPERLYSGAALRNLATYPKLVGGLGPASRDRAAAFYDSVLDAEIVAMSSAEAAEFAKLADTTYRDVNIALANEFASYADRIGVDVTEVIAAANSQPYSHIHQPGLGVGGHCIPVYPHFLLDRAPELSLVARPASQRRPGRRRDRGAAGRARFARRGRGAGPRPDLPPRRQGARLLAGAAADRAPARGGRPRARVRPAAHRRRGAAIGRRAVDLGSAARASARSSPRPATRAGTSSMPPGSPTSGRPRRPQQPRRLGATEGVTRRGIGQDKVVKKESDETWLTETLYDDVRLSIKVERVVFDSQTEHQRLVVADSRRFGGCSASMGSPS